MRKIFLIGNPNVGKSVFFSRLTGTHVITSNYPGTTVEFTKGEAVLGKEEFEIVDVPGTYTLNPTCKAEEVACEMLKSGATENDVIINVVDSTNLERNLSLTLELMERPIPVIVALNMWDDTKHKGITIDVKRLELWLGVPVITTSAVSGEGFSQLSSKIREARTPMVKPHTSEERWKDIGDIIEKIQHLEHRHHTLFEFIKDLTVNPVGDILFAAAAAYAAFMAIRFIGEGLIQYIADPFFERLWLPVIMKASSLLGSGGIVHDILVGKLINGQIDYVQSFGVFSTALYVEFAMVLPYIIAFYFVLGILEDSGYLPRLAILMDNFMHRMGLHGFAIIPTLLAFGCNVPGILATRVLESKRERFIASTLISIGIPCAALQAMIIGILGKHGIGPILTVYGTLAFAWVVLGFILNRLTPGFSPELLIEIPPYRLPQITVLFRKTWWRIKQFIVEALPVVMVSILVVNVLYMIGIFNAIAGLTAPVITGLLGLPEEAITPVVIGFLRKDIAVGMLVPLSLSIKQLIVSCVVLSMFFPCVATFTIMWKELGWKDMAKATAIMITTAVFTGSLLNLVL